MRSKLSSMLTVSILCGQGVHVYASDVYPCHRQKPIEIFEWSVKENKEFLERSTSKGDYFDSSIDQDFIDLSESPSKKPNTLDLGIIKEARLERASEITYIMREQAGRYSVYYSLPSGSAKLLRWYVKESGGNLCLPEKIINYKKGNYMGMISLNRSKSSDLCAWKASVFNKSSFSYSDFVMTTRCQDTGPALEKSIFLKEFESILNN
ncbi:hypothetical protein ACFX58_19380 [Sphingomonas sp. NCPPB 2930]